MLINCATYFTSLERGFAGPKVLPMVDDVKFGKVYIHIDGEDDELEKLAETLQARGVKVVGEVETKPWGMKELLTEDPDGVSDEDTRCSDEN